MRSGEHEAATRPSAQVDDWISVHVISVHVSVIHAALVARPFDVKAVLLPVPATCWSRWTDLGGAQ
jgi:hypothetical protein